MGLSLHSVSEILVLSVIVGKNKERLDGVVAGGILVKSARRGGSLL